MQLNFLLWEKSLEYTKIPEMFFTPHHLLYQPANQGEKRSSGIRSTMASKIIVVKMWLKTRNTVKYGRTQVFFAYAYETTLLYVVS
jgi:hypothetical protein